jgi:tetratricopeptide (TPR) repeat protein
MDNVIPSAKTRILLKKLRVDQVSKRIGTGSYRIYREGDLILDKYRVIKSATGGFGLVYFCRSYGTYGPLVVKTLLPELIPNPLARQLFHQEADAWINLGPHPNIVKVLQVGELDGSLALYFDLIIGDPRYGNDLSGYLGRFSFTVPEALLLAKQLCDGIIYATECFNGIGRQFVHCDIKPSNILIDTTLTPKLTDLGLVQSSADSLNASRGTPGYIAPEVYSGSAPNRLSDIYSFGCVLYELLSNGRSPFKLEAVELQQDPLLWGDMIQHKHQSESPSPLEPILPDSKAKAAILELVDRTLSKRPKDRYQTFDEVRVAIEDVYQQLVAGSEDCHHCDHDGTSVVLGAKLSDTHSRSEHDTLHELDNRAQSFFKLGFHERALQCWDEMLSISYEPRALRGKGDVLAALNRCPEALSCYEESLRILPHDIEQWLDKGLLLERENRSQEALECFDTALSVPIQPNTIWGNKGHPVQIMMVNTSAQKAAFQSWVDGEMKKGYVLLGQVLLSKAELFEKLGRAQEALVCVDEALTKNSSFPTAWRSKSRILGSLGRQDEADECLARAMSVAGEEWVHELGLSLCGHGSEIGDIVAMVPSESEHGRVGYLFFKGVELLRDGQAEDSITYLNEYLAFHDDRPAAYWYKSAALRKCNRMRDAIVCLDRCLSLSPDRAEVWAEKGGCFAECGPEKFSEALLCFQRAIEIDRRCAGAYRGLIYLLYSLGRTEEAGKWAVDAIAVTQPWSNRGLEFTRQQRYQEALDEFERVLEFLANVGLRENVTPANAYKGTALLGLRRFGEAVQAYDSALEMFPDDIVAWLNRGTALLHQGNLEGAINSYDEVLARDPGHAAAYVNKSLALYELGRIAEAEECWRRSEELGVSDIAIKFPRNP